MESGVLYAEGKKCMTKGMMGVAEYEKITEEEAIAIENDGDPIDAPPGKIRDGLKRQILY